MASPFTELEYREDISVFMPNSMCNAHNMHANLLDACDVSRDELDGDGVLHCQPMTLALHPCFVNQNTSIGGET